MKRSLIEWCDFSGGNLNFVVRGSTPGDCEVSSGCAHCYALRMHQRFGNLPKYTMVYPEKLQRLLTMPFPAEGNRRGPGSKPLLFPCDTGDLFHPNVPDEFIRQAFTVMAICTEWDWMVLTKRPERLSKWFNLAKPKWFYPKSQTWPFPNVWLGTSIEDQATADERIPWLLRTPAAKRFISYEPALGPVDFSRVKHGSYVINPLTREYGTSRACVTFQFGMANLGGLDLVIAGGETGPGARPAHPDWFRSVRDQCQAAGVAFFLKSLGEWMTKDNSSPNDEMWPPFKRVHCWNPERPSFACAHHDWAYQVGKKAAGRLLDGREWNEWPTT